MSPWILARNGRPFLDAQAAHIKCELLRAELGASIVLEVRDHPEGGYGICCPSLLGVDLHEGSVPFTTPSAPAVQPGPARPFSPRETPSPVRPAPALSQGAKARPAPHIEKTRIAYPDEFRLSPAARGFLGDYFLILLGLVLVFEPHVVFVTLGRGSPTAPLFVYATLSTIMVGGAATALICLSHIFWACIDHTYVIDRIGLQQIEWQFSRSGLLRRVPRIRFEHLRSVEINQRISEVLLNVGTVRVTAGASSGAELALKQVPAPRRLQAELQQRMQRALAESARLHLTAEVIR